MPLIDRLVAEGKEIRLFLDFHSTATNLFYVQADAEATIPENFARNWLLAARPQLENYPFTIEARHNSGQPTSKNYMYARFGIPSITFEVGDETERAAATAASAVFAREMMKLMNGFHD